MTLKDEFNKGMDKMHSGADDAAEHVRDAAREVKHQFKDSEEDVNAKVDQEKEKEDTLWNKFKEGVAEARENVKEALTGEIHEADDQL